MKSLIILLVLGAAVLFGQGPLKKVTRAEAINGVTSKSQPDYPAMARQLKIEGTVELDAVITETGAVEDVSIVSGNPILTKPAAEAVKKWKFAPFLQDGKPVRASAPITIVFKKQ
jgi:protein TonB